MSYHPESADMHAAAAGAAAKRPRLLDEVRRVLRVKHYSLRMEHIYAGWIRRFILSNGKRHPRDMGPAEVERFLSRLAVEGGVAASTQNQALSALLFLYREVLRIELPWLAGVTRAKRPVRVPTVLSRDEVTRVLSRMDGRPWLLASLLYGAGLRLMEALRLRVKDVDFERGEITVRDGKGGKDRHTVLPRSLVAPLRREVERARLLHRADLLAGFGGGLAAVRAGAQVPVGGARAWLAVRVPGAAALARSPRRPRAAAPFRRSAAVAHPEARLPRGRGGQAGQRAYAAPQFRDAPAGVGQRHPHGTGAAWPQGCQNHADLYARPESRWARCAEPAGPLSSVPHGKPRHGMTQRPR